VLFHPQFLTLHLEALDEESLILINAKNFNASQYPQLKAKIICIPFTQLAKQQIK
jgi:hypothetical protein